MTTKEHLARIDQKLTDFIDAHNTKHQELEDRIRPLVRLKNKIDQPVKWVGSVVILSAAALATWAVEHGADWIKGHWGK